MLMKDYTVAGLSIALIDNGQISMAEGFGLLEAGTNKKVNSNSIFNACSISKFLTSMLVMILTEQGILDLDEDVNNRLSSWKVPDNKFTQNKKVTLRTLLSHQSGVIDPEGSFTELISTAGVPNIVELLEGRSPYCQVPIKAKFEPGSDFHYSDAGFCIIQQLIEDSTGKPFKEVMNELIFEPLKMKSCILDQSIPIERSEIFSCGHNKNGEIINGKYPLYPYPAASGLWTTPSDLAILVIELMNSLQGKSKIGLTTSKATEIISSQGCKEWTGLGIFLDSFEQELEISSLGWGVGFQCLMVAYPNVKTGAVIMTNTDLEVHQLKGIIGEVYNSLKHTFLKGL